MKLFKIWFEELKKTYPNFSHDEIDCALTWKGALETVQLWIKKNPSCGELERLNNTIKEELGNSR